MESRNVLIAGGIGFIGSHLVDEFIKKDYRVYATYHNKTPQNHLSDVTWRYANLTNAELCQRVMRNVDTVVMAAAVTSGAAVIARNPLAHVTENVVMNVRLLGAAHEAGVKKYLFISSNVVYPDSDLPVIERWATMGQPHEKYFWVGNMKRYIEKLCYGYATQLVNPMKVVVVRPANCYGPRDEFDPKLSHVIPALIRKVVERQEPLEVWGTGDDVRDFIYIDDLARGILAAFETDEQYFDVNLASGQGFSIRQILDVLLRLDNYNDANVMYRSDMPTTIPLRLLSTQKAERKLRFKAEIGLEEGLKRTLEWYKENKCAS